MQEKPRRFSQQCLYQKEEMVAHIRTLIYSKVASRIQYTRCFGGKGHVLLLLIKSTLESVFLQLYMVVRTMFNLMNTHT